MNPRSWLDLTITTRVLFALVFFAAQLGLITTVQLRPDRVFAYQMFNASSSIRISLERRVRQAHGGARVVRVHDGKWTARDAAGQIHAFSWGMFVRDPVLGVLDREIHAKYGADAQLLYLRHALDYVVQNTPQDAETTALIARVQLWDNGRPRAPLELEAVRP